MPTGRRDPTVRVTAQSSEACAHLIWRLIEAINRLADVMRQHCEVHRTTAEGRVLGGGSSALTAPPVDALKQCNHREGHELRLNANEALEIEACRECPCCGARLWIGFPSVGAILDATTLDRLSNVPGLEVELTRRERQVLNVLHRSPYALRHGQLAALVWSDPHRTREVRSVLYRLRRKLRDSGWAISFPAKGNGVRLVPDTISQRQSRSAGQQSEQGSDVILHNAA